MESKDKMGYSLVPSEEKIIHQKEPVKEYSPVYNDEDGGKEEGKKKKKKKLKNSKKLRHRKTFWVCFSNVEIGSSKLFHDDENKKKKDDDELKVKDGFLFSNVDIEPEEEGEKVQKLVENMSKKSCFFVCFSSIQVGQ